LPSLVNRWMRLFPGLGNCPGSVLPAYRFLWGSAYFCSFW
jgi:hypothetical protein